MHWKLEIYLGSVYKSISCIGKDSGGGFWKFVKQETLKILIKVKSPGLVALELSDSLIFKVQSLKEKPVEATKRFVHDSSSCTYKLKK